MVCYKQFYILGYQWYIQFYQLMIYHVNQTVLQLSLCQAITITTLLGLNIKSARGGPTGLRGTCTIAQLSMLTLFSIQSRGGGGGLLQKMGAGLELSLATFKLQVNLKKQTAQQKLGFCSIVDELCSIQNTLLSTRKYDIPHDSQYNLSKNVLYDTIYSIQLGLAGSQISFLSKYIKYELNLNPQNLNFICQGI